MISEDLSIAYYLDSQHLLNQHHPVFPMNLFFFISLMVAWKKSTDVEHHMCSFFQTEGIGRRRSYFKILITTHRHSIRQTILEFMSRTPSIESTNLHSQSDASTQWNTWTTYCDWKRTNTTNNFQANYLGNTKWYSKFSKSFGKLCFGQKIQDNSSWTIFG